jgi:hypothetical protein
LGRAMRPALVSAACAAVGEGLAVDRCLLRCARANALASKLDKLYHTLSHYRSLSAETFPGFPPHRCAQSCWAGGSPTRRAVISSRSSSGRPDERNSTAIPASPHECGARPLPDGGPPVSALATSRKPHLHRGGQGVPTPVSEGVARTTRRWGPPAVVTGCVARLFCPGGRYRHGIRECEAPR